MKVELTYDPKIPTVGYISKIIESRILKTYLHIHSHWRSIHNTQAVKETQMSIER
jgi:hypothetical protein